MNDRGIRKHLRQALLPLLPAIIATTAHAASFDCKLASSKVDTMICADNAVSKLDDQLAAVYAQFRQTSGDERAAKAGQLAWLKSRNACADFACVKRAYETRIAELQARSASASPIAGFWKLEYSCAKATGMYEEMCKQGERDVFELAVQVKGGQVCIIHMATAQLGNRVDEVDGLEPSMTGLADGKTATVRFRSAWGGRGTAELRVDGTTLHWKVSAKDGGQSWIPDQAELARVPAGHYDRMPICQG